MLTAYQTHTTQLVFTMQISFTKDNNEEIKRADYEKLLASNGKNRSIPFVIKKAPNEKYFKLRDRINKLHYSEYTNGIIVMASTLDFHEYATEMNYDTLGNKEYGTFMKILDNYSLGRDYSRQYFLGLSFLSDGVWVFCFTRALGLPLGSYEKEFFRVSLDLRVYFHDVNFDSSEWLFLDFRFVNMKNDRFLAVLNYYNLQGKLIATLLQEVYSSLH
ncbi:hypothetical protein Cantr_04096 [Candida viswanathii]|uniref:Acyl-CoA thioesterase-like C-terminal domain-containing protein n=1 Tax=Candida viswanathii TaxID=5486 RepID=A0A367XMT2_9ASCO|nr:hypothetical protein Cantr_04096 [Candida viswanathii]